MPPSKASRAAAHEDTDSKPTNSKEKNGHNTHQTNGKMRRVASSTGSNLKEVQNAANMLSPTTEAPTSAPASNPSIQWTAFDRDFLHRYRREYHLNTPTAYASDYRSWVLTQPGSIGLYSPTLARRKELRRQQKGELANTVRKHFSSQAVQENDAIVDFVHRVRRGRLTKTTGPSQIAKKVTRSDWL